MQEAECSDDEGSVICSAGSASDLSDFIVSDHSSDEKSDSESDSILCDSDASVSSSVCVARAPVTVRRVRRVVCSETDSES